MESRKIANISREVCETLRHGTVVVLDTETTGFSQYNDRIIEFAAVRLVDGVEVASISELIDPERHIPEETTAVHHITDEMVKGRGNEAFFAPLIFGFLADARYIVGHNVSFDIRFIESMFSRCGISYSCEYVDTLSQARKLYAHLPNHKLTTLAEYLDLRVDAAHRALSDVRTTVDLLNHIIEDSLSPYRKCVSRLSLEEESMCFQGLY